MNAPFRPAVRTMADLLRQLGDVPPARVRLVPTPGTATIDDLLKPENSRCELVDGTLVEKPVGHEESFFANSLSVFLTGFVDEHNLGYVTGEHGLVELPGGVDRDPVRAPDLTFYAWADVPGARLPNKPIPKQSPTLVVEVLSRSNSKAEMARKRREYFRAGTRLVWEFDPRARTVRVYTAEDAFTDLTPADTLDGGDVLPGFTLPLKKLFAKLDRHG